MAAVVTAVAPDGRASIRRSASRGPLDPPQANATLPPGETQAKACEGSIEVSCGGRRVLARWSAAKPSAPLLAIGRCETSRSVSEMAVHLRGTMATPGAKTRTVNFGAHLAARIDSGDALARACVERLFDLGRGGDEISAPLADALVRALALHVFSRYAAPVAAPPRYGDRLAAGLVRHLRSFIDAKLDQRLSRDDLARIAGYDAREFSTAFRNTFGMTPMQYVIERRLDRACVLIANTARDLADIAISSGFSSQSHMTSTLKKRRGITPLRLRRQSARAMPVGLAR